MANEMAWMMGEASGMPSQPLNYDSMTAQAGGWTFGSAPYTPPSGTGLRAGSGQGLMLGWQPLWDENMLSPSSAMDGAWSALDAEDAELFGIGAGAHTMDAARIQYQQQAGRETARIVEQQSAEAAQLRAAAEAQRASQVNRLVSAAYVATADNGHSQIADQNSRELNRSMSTTAGASSRSVAGVAPAQVAGVYGEFDVTGTGVAPAPRGSGGWGIPLLQGAQNFTARSLGAIDSLVDSGDLSPAAGAFWRGPVAIGAATLVEGPAALLSLTDLRISYGLANAVGDLIGPDPAARNSMRTTVSNYFSTRSFGEIASDTAVVTGSLLAGGGIAGKIGELRAVTNKSANLFLDEVSTTWRGHEAAVVGRLQSTLGDDFASKVYLRVETPSGRTYTIIPDGLERSGNSFIVHDAKFSQSKDLMNLPTQQLRSTFTTNQKPAFDAIAAGEAKVTLLNSQGGRALLRDEFRVGMPINVQPSMNLYVNTPSGIVKRTWP